VKLLPSKAFLRSRFTYCAETGRLHWLPLDPVDTPDLLWKQHYVRDAARAAGHMDEKGRYRVQLLGKNWLLHRLVWQWHYGDVEEKTLSYGGRITHLDGDYSNCRIENLDLSNHLPTDPRRRSIGGVTVRTRVLGR